MSIKGAYINPNCDKTLSLCLHSCGIGIFTENFCHGPNIRSEYIIHYIIKGKGFLETPEGVFPFGEGDIFCIYPGEVIKYCSDGVVCDFGFINFVGTDAERIYSAIRITRQKPVAHINCDSIIEPIRQCMYYLKNTDSPSQLRLNSFLLEALSYMEYKPKTKSKDIYIDRGIAYMKYHFGTDISIDDIADAAGIEKSYFQKLFKEQIGVSTISYLNGIRIKKAKELIASGIDFKSVAVAVGINDVYYFSKLFTKTEGITPSAYRKNLKRGQ